MKLGLLPWLVIAAAVLVGLGLAAIVRDVRNPDADDEDHGHRRQPWLAWLLLVPIAMVAFVVPPALGAHATSPAPVSVSQRHAFPPLPASDAPTVSLPEVVMRAAADSQLARVHLSGPGASTAASHPDDTWLRIRGQIVPGSSHTEDGFIPTMTVTGVVRIDRPANTYAY